MKRSTFWPFFMILSCLSYLYFKPASAADTSIPIHLSDLKSLPTNSYQIAKATFLPNIKDSEIGFISHLTERDESANPSSKCGDEFSFTACPLHGKCTVCEDDSVNKRYRWDGCEDGYWPNPDYENKCLTYSCSMEGYQSSYADKGYVCTKLNRYGKECYDCTLYSGYIYPCDISSYSSSEGILRLEEIPACQNLASNQVCSENHCKLVCEAGYYISVAGICKKDACQSGYQLEKCSASQKQIATIPSINKTTTCYQCADDTCPDGYSKAACASGYTTVDTKTTAAGSTCRKCDSIDKLCADYPLKSCTATGINSCYPCPYDSSRFKINNCSKGYAPYPAEKPTMCFSLGENCSKLGSEFKDSLEDGDVCTKITLTDGSTTKTCPKNCTNYADYSDSCTNTTGTKRTENSLCVNAPSDRLCATKHCKTTCETGYYYNERSGRCREDSCPDGYQLEKCTTSGNYKTTPSDSGQNTCYQCQSIVYTNCYPGDILYADKTCTTVDTYQNVAVGKTAIGIVLSNEERLAAAFTCEKAPWQSSPSDVPGIPRNSSYTDSSLRQDFNGESYTNSIVSACSTGDAAHYASSYLTEGTNKGDWWLPSFGQADLFTNNNVKTTYNTIAYSCGPNSINSFWTSNEGWNGKYGNISITTSDAFAYYYSNGGQPGFISKTNKLPVIPITSF